MMQHVFHRQFSLSRVWQKRLLCLSMVGLLLFTMAGCQQPVTDSQPSSSQTGQTDPIADSALTNPAPTNPAPANPAPTNPAPTNPAPTNSAPTNTAPTDPAPTNPAPTDPAPTNTVPTDPAPTNPAPTDPAPTNPVPTDPAPTNPAPTNPVPTNPAPSEPQPPAAGLTGAIYNLTPGTAYKFGMVQQRLDETVYYLTGYMEGKYMETTTDIEAAADLYIETTDGGFYIYVVTEGTKRYINMKESGAHIECSYDSSASTVYTLHMGSGNDGGYHAGTPVTTINEEKYCLGVRGGSSYTDMGPRSISEYNYYGEFYGEVIAPGCDWILGTWESVWRTDYEMDGLLHSDLWVDMYSFDLKASWLGGCGYTSWDHSIGAPGDHWDIAPMGYPSTDIGITFTGDQLTVTVIYEDFAEEDAKPYTHVYTVTRLEDGFISITDPGGRAHTYMLTGPDTTLEELCQALGVDYSLPSN